MSCYYDKTLSSSAKILDTMRSKYPRMTNSIHGKNLLSFLGYDDKMFNPARPKLVSPAKYKQLYISLKNFSENKFISRLMNQ